MMAGEDFLTPQKIVPVNRTLIWVQLEILFKAMNLIQPYLVHNTILVIFTRQGEVVHDGW